MEIEGAEFTEGCGDPYESEDGEELTGKELTAGWGAP